MRSNLLIAVSVIFFGCTNADLGEYKYTPLNKVEIKIQLKELNYYYNPPNSTNSLNFTLEVKNESKENVYLNVGELEAKINGSHTIRTSFDSIGSVATKMEKLRYGKTSYHCLFLLDGQERIAAIHKFEVVNFGLKRH